MVHRVHVLFEHGADGKPFGSAYARLLRPLTHPRVASAVRVSFGHTLPDEQLDLVVVDRLWRPDVTADLVAEMISAARASGARIVHALDDNFPDLVLDRPEWATDDQLAALDVLLAGVDGFLVTTEPLAERYRVYNRNVAVVPNALDERLVDQAKYRRLLKRLLPRGGRPITVGYMGTYTHDGDLAMIAPAIRKVHETVRAGVRFQFVGVATDLSGIQELDGLPVETIPPTPDLAVYPTFVPWFLNTFQWDVALSPLRRTPFTVTKSDIKFLDYAALGAAGVYSRHPSYEGTVRHGETGWLADDDTEAWFGAIETLIHDGRLRRRIARRAKAYLHRERTLKRTAHRWPEALTALLTGAHHASRSASGEARTKARPMHADPEPTP